MCDNENNKNNLYTFIKHGGTMKTDLIAVYFFKLLKSENFKEMFSNLSELFSRSLNDFCLADSQAEIERVIQEKRDWLCKKNLNTLVLFKNEEEFFVLCTGLNNDETVKKFVYKFKDDFTWEAEHSFCIAVPEFSKTFAEKFLELLTRIKQLTFAYVPSNIGLPR